MKKKYNPFKMWGSWIGGIILSIPMLLLSLSIFTGGFETAIENSPSLALGALGIALICSGGSGSMGCIYLFFLIGILIQFIVGFLIGWGINSLWRKFK